MDDLIEFESSSDESMDHDQIESNKSKDISTSNNTLSKTFDASENNVNLLIWKDVLESHCSLIDDKKGINFFKTEVNGIINDNKLNPSNINVKKWKCGLSMNTLPEDLKPKAFMKCQEDHQNPKRCSTSPICSYYIPSDSYLQDIHKILNKKPLEDIKKSSFNVKTSLNLNHKTPSVLKLNNINTPLNNLNNVPPNNLNNFNNTPSNNLNNYNFPSKNTNNYNAPSNNANNFNNAPSNNITKYNSSSNNINNNNATSNNVRTYNAPSNNLNKYKTPSIINEKEKHNPNNNPFAFNNYYKEQNEEINKLYERKEDEGKILNLNQNKQNNIGSFRTAMTELKIQAIKKDKGKSNQQNNGTENGSNNWLSNSLKKTLGTTKSRSVNSKFIPPIKKEEKEEDFDKYDKGLDGDEEEIEQYKGIDKVMVERIENEIMDKGKPVHWDDIAGLGFAKNTIQEIIVWPLLRPDIFTGLRRPPKGILLFGPPGTGKTLIGKCVAAQSRSTFFCISASTLTSKWYGEGEKMVRALFAVASVHQPSIIFIDEIDSLLCQRSDQENETSRRLKTEFLIQLDGAATLEDDLVLVIGATNRPQELDEAARRRLVKRLYIPLPELKARCEIVSKLMTNINNCLTDDDVEEIGRLTDTYSGADMANLCKEASLGPVRSIDLSKVDALDVRPINIEDFRAALRNVRPSVCQADLNIYDEWNSTFGSGGL